MVRRQPWLDASRSWSLPTRRPPWPAGQHPLDPISTRDRRGRGGLRSERAGGRGHARPGGGTGHGARGGRPDRRRHPQLRADPARTPARRVLGVPPDRDRVTVPALARPGPVRPAVAPAAAGPRASARRRARGRAGADARRDGGRSRRRTAVLDAAVPNRSSRASTGWPTEFLQPVPHLPRHPLRLARFGLRAMLPATVLARRFGGRTRRGRCSRGGGPPAAPVAGPVLRLGRADAHRGRARVRLAGGRGRLAGDHHGAGRAACASTAARSRPACRSRPTRSCAAPTS